MNYPRIEAYYHQVDIPNSGLRRALNLTEAWILEIIQDKEVWERDFAPVLNEGFEEADLRAKLEDKWGTPDDDGLGSFVLERIEAPVDPDAEAVKPKINFR